MFADRMKRHYSLVTIFLIGTIMLLQSELPHYPVPASKAQTSLTTLELRVAASADDAEEGVDGNISLTSSDLELVDDGGDQIVGMRFAGVEIPQAAFIARAYIQFEVDETDDIETNLTIQAEATGNAAEFSRSDTNISSRPATESRVSWTPAPWSVVGEAGPDQRTPDIAQVMQEVVNQSGWASGNALTVMITGSGKRVAKSFDGDAAAAPLLHVEYAVSDQQAPAVDAGPDQRLTFPDQAVLNGTVTDDGLPDPPGRVEISWSKVSGPGQVIFGDAAAVTTTASFSLAGSYVLSLSADDGEFRASDQVTIMVDPAAIAPDVAYFSPVSAPVTMAVLITGSNFGGATGVTFNGIAADFSVLSDSEIQAIVPMGATSGPISVTNATGTGTSVDDFNVMEVPTFPGAEGFGAKTIGGKGGRVIEVTNLNDSGPGSLRAAIDATGPRVVVFRVAGTIELLTNLTVENPYLTIAGQTAPGDGIAIRNNAINGDTSLNIKTHDVVVRYIRIRPGGSPNDNGSLHAINIGSSTADVYNVVIDHGSFSWGTDEVLSAIEGSHHVTVQWSIIAEGLHCSTHVERNKVQCHSMGSLITADQNISIHHNLYAHNIKRNPKINTIGVVDVVNNVVYNPGFGSGPSAPTYVESSRGIAKANYVGNTFKPGVNTATADWFIDTSGGTEVYEEANIVPNLVLDPDSEVDRVLQRHAADPVTTSPPQVAFDQVLALAGASRGLNCDGTWYFRRDSADERLINDVTNGTGQVIDDPAEVGGWPDLAAGIACPDGDQDGMPDEWESLHGFDPANAADDLVDVDRDGYGNLEEFLNGTDPGGSGGNTPPTANSDAVMTIEDTPTAVTLSATDPDSCDLNFAILNPPARGSLGEMSAPACTEGSPNTINAMLMYTPEANFSGADSFTYSASDGVSGSNAALVTIDVAPDNDPPVANDDGYTVEAGALLIVQAPEGVLANDADIDSGDTLAASLTGSASLGVVSTFNGDGSFIYAAAETVSGQDTFTYQACDLSAACAAATVVITVTPPNDPPLAVDDLVTTSEGSALTVVAPGVLSNDYDLNNGDILLVSAVNDDPAAVGTEVVLASGAWLTLNQDGSYFYDPAGQFETLAEGQSTQDSFTYQVSDGLDNSTAAVTITINGLNDPPVAAGDAYTVDQDSTLTVIAPGVLGNDTDLDGDSLAAALWSGPNNGTASLNLDGSFSYTPALGFAGVDGFSYQASDGKGGTSVASVALTVTGIFNVIAISPGTVPAGYAGTVTITGTGFVPGSTVTFENGSGPAPVASDIIVSPPGTSLTATLSVKSGGPARERVWDVRVSRPDNSSAVLPAALTVAP